LLVVVAVGVRVIPSMHESLWLDEVVSARIITQPTLSSTVAQVRKTESSPPGWHLLNWAVWRGVGEPRIEDLRLLSVVFGAALAALTFWYASSLGLSRLSAFLAGGLAAVGPNVVAHGAELRPYALLTLLSLVLVIAVERAARRPDRRNLIVFASVVLLGSYVHYFFLLALAVALAWAFVRVDGGACARISVAATLSLVPFLVWLPDFRFQYRHNLYAYNGSFNLRAVAYSYARIIGVFGATGVASALVRLSVSAIVIWGGYLLLRKPVTELAGVMAVAPVAMCAFLWLLGPHIFNERNLLIAMPFAAIAIGRASDQLAPRPLLAVGFGVAVAMVAGVSLWQWEMDYGRSSYDAIANTLVRDGWNPSGEIVQFGPAPLGLSQPVGWYLPGHPLLVSGRKGTCRTQLFGLSYDPGQGARWIRSHALSTTVRAFAAFDHTPRGPKASTPIVVAKLTLTTVPSRAAASVHARLLHVASRFTCTSRISRRTAN
jgi:hypothetical protein